jgi:hypothetical protein
MGLYVPCMFLPAPTRYVGAGVEGLTSMDLRIWADRRAERSPSLIRRELLRTPPTSGIHYESWGEVEFSVG